MNKIAILALSTIFAQSASAIVIDLDGLAANIDLPQAFVAESDYLLETESNQGWETLSSPIAGEGTAIATDKKSDVWDLSRVDGNPFTLNGLDVAFDNNVDQTKNPFLIYSAYDANGSASNNIFVDLSQSQNSIVFSNLQDITAFSATVRYIPDLQKMDKWKKINTGVSFDNIAVVPEPAGMALGMAAVAGCLAMTRRKRAPQP